MFICTDKAKVDAIYAETAPRSVTELMAEIHPEATFDGCRYHAPCDGYVCPLTDRVFRAGEFLPMTDTPEGQYRFPVTANASGEVVMWYGTLAQLNAVRFELRQQTDAYMAMRSRHVGTIGKRQKFTVTVKYRKMMIGYYGNTYFHILNDENGNVIIYRGSKDLSRFAGFIKITASVKAHEMRNGVPQTLIDRPKSAEQYVRL